ncbi:anaerobic sulfatase maturase [Ruminococcus sp. AF31-8BH]|uniref:anaerobic sulfatase maturase n=1 Tax=Ruminococcus sp. AF31-8BH TaxID=2293174 RepID=UPI000E4B38F1|nr:anaerobic sulfatase maturase [Ruminococcus sp. AF31-8BH]RGF72606.1 anaerobic sulfatase maturase [Ruminococcus sp. AF31-8BH]
MLQNILIKPASGLCNMRCDYCFYCDEATKRNIPSYGMMEEKTIKNIIRKVLRQNVKNVCFAFQGGEPTLRGQDFFEKVIELENQYNTHHCSILNSLQTNGLCIDENWCSFFKKHNFLVGVSVDGIESVHNLYRHDKNEQGTYHRIRENIKLLEKYNVEYNILTVVNRQVAENIKQIYKEYRENGWNYQQYILCLDPLGEQQGQKEYSLTPEIYGQFLIDLFQLWYKDWRRNRAPYIRQFENYIGILLGYPPESCEQRGICSVQCVTEADGSVYPCDFYVIDEYKLGNFNTDQITDFFESNKAKDFVMQSKKLHKKCLQCKYLPLCRSGCRRSRIKDEMTGTYYNYFCEGYRRFFEICGPELANIAKYIKRQKEGMKKNL